MKIINRLISLFKKKMYFTEDYGKILFEILCELDYENRRIRYNSLLKEEPNKVSITFTITKKDINQLKRSLKKEFKKLFSYIKNVGDKRNTILRDIYYIAIYKRNDTMLDKYCESYKENTTVTWDVFKYEFDKARKSVHYSDMQKKKRFDFLNKSHYEFRDMSLDLFIDKKDNFDNIMISIDYIRDPDEDDGNERKYTTAY